MQLCGSGVDARRRARHFHSLAGRTRTDAGITGAGLIQFHTCVLDKCAEARGFHRNLVIPHRKIVESIFTGPISVGHGRSVRAHVRRRNLGVRNDCTACIGYCAHQVSTDRLAEGNADAQRQQAEQHTNKCQGFEIPDALLHDDPLLAL